MNTNTLTMSKADAKAKAEKYRKALKRRSDPDYSAAAEIYELLAQGKTLIDVGAAIRGGGFDHKMRPKLALARADRRQVTFIWEPWSDVGTFDSNQRNVRQFDQMRERVNFNQRHGLRDINLTGGWVRGYALVPLIPADVRPPGNARDWHILWEVEQWSDTHIGAQPDRDPYLLRRVRGDLFEVLAEWDLTEVERFVMQSRAVLR